MKVNGMMLPIVRGGTVLLNVYVPGGVQSYELNIAAGGTLYATEGRFIAIPEPIPEPTRAAPWWQFWR